MDYIASKVPVLNSITRQGHRDSSFMRKITGSSRHSFDGTILFVTDEFVVSITVIDVSQHQYRDK
jgi:hypothetical protein